MKKAICILSVLAILLCAWLVLLWLPALTHEGKPQSETRYGLSEGLQLVEQTFAGKEKRYVVEDGEGNVVFDVPLRGCILDTRFRGGRLRFREQQSGREGYIDRQGIVTLLHEGKASIPEEVATGRTTRFARRPWLRPSNYRARPALHGLAKAGESRRQQREETSL